jgi:hypothetical protein
MAVGRRQHVRAVVTRITIDFRYVEIEYELWALGHMLEGIEPAMERIAQQDASETLEDLKRSGWARDEAEVDLALQDISEKRDYVLPRFMRGRFVVSLWACFESGVQTVARTMREEVGAQIELGELRGESFVARARRYFEALLGLPLDGDEARYRRLVDLSQVRNALAHANGLREGMSRERWRELERTLSRNGVEVDTFRGAVVLSHAYVASAYNDVNASLRSLVTGARANSANP